MIDGQAARILSSGGVDARVRGPVVGTPYRPPARPGVPGVDALVRSDLPISVELGGFLTRQLSSARAHDPNAITTAGATTLATLLAAPDPWPVERALELLQRIAALLDTADLGGVTLGTFTPSCVVVSDRYLVLARPDARAGVDPAYVAPEQLQRGARVDGRASQYGLALIASTLLGGEARAPGLLRAIRRRRATPGALSAECARAVQRVVVVARDPDPARRFRTASEFVTALGVACGMWTMAEPATVAVALPGASRSLLLVGSMLGVAASAGAIGWYAARRPVVIPPELANDIAIGRVITDTSRAPVAAGLGAVGLGARPDSGTPAVNEQYGYRLLMAAPPRDSATPANGVAAPVTADTTPLPSIATAIALPRAESTREGLGRVTTPTEFAAAGVAQALRRDGVGGNAASETTPTLLSDGDGPAYPTDLLRTRTQGEVVVRFVIDAEGRVDPATFQVLESSHPSFTNSVRAALGRLRYAPAERGGRHVSASVEQRFRFAVPSR